MPPEDRVTDLVKDMQRYSLQAQRLISNRSSEAMADPETRLALERALEIVGEAASQLPSGFREAHPDIPWHQIIGMRNILAHRYASVDAGILWRTVTDRLPELLAQLDALLQERPDQP